MVRTTNWPSAKLSPQQKAIVAAHAVLNLAEGKAGERELRSLLVNEIGLAWAPLNCLQYLSGKEAPAALTALPDEWQALERNKKDPLRASVISLVMVKDVCGAGGYLCEITYAARAPSLLARLRAWDEHWPGVRAALARDSGVPLDWSARPCGPARVL